MKPKQKPPEWEEKMRDFFKNGNFLHVSPSYVDSLVQIMNRLLEQEKKKSYRTGVFDEAVRLHKEIKKSYLEGLRATDKKLNDYCEKKVQEELRKQREEIIRECEKGLRYGKDDKSWGHFFLEKIKQKLGEKI